jgi:hypothetical protein
MEEYERKDKMKNTKNSKNLDLMIPSQREDFDWWRYRSRSPLAFSTKRCKNHRRD